MSPMTVTLTPEQTDVIRRAVESGAYHSHDEVLEQALALFAKQEQLDSEALRKAYREGLASGAPRRVSADILLASFKERAARGRL